MFISIFYYRLLLLLRDRSNIFFMLIFPLILITGLGMMLNDIMSPNSLLVAEPFAVVYENKTNSVLETEFADFLQNREITEMLTFSDYDNYDEAKAAYQSGKVSGIVVVKSVENGLTIDVQTAEPTGMIGKISQSIFGSFASMSNAVMQVYMNGGIVDTSTFQDSYIANETLAWQKKVPNAYEYYMVTNLVMTALFAAFYALNILEDNEISQGIGVRLRTTPIPMWMNIMGQLSAALLVILVQMGIIVLFAHFVLGAYVGTNIGLVALLLLVTALLGLGIGSMFAAIRSMTMASRLNVLRTTLILLTFLAGGYVAGIENVLLSVAPFLEYILPSFLAQNALFEAIFFENIAVYWQNLGILAVMAVAALTLGITLARRKL
ncbi:ABC transporter permease [Culicoidibacter larvae]|nr:ABC transporter permease [Culicoidibacter larvae]